MLIIDSPFTDAYFNIASEEYLLSRFPAEEIFLLYVNAPAIIVGKFQNTLAEINLDYVTANKIKVVRRLSGGGAVYHDLGNLNFSFHTLLGDKDFMEFSTFTQPIVQLLNNLAIPAKLEGRNDLLVDGKKFSGNAKVVKNGKMIQHGTILLDSDMGVLADALQINPLKFTDKAVKSNRSRVTNLLPYLPAGMSLLEFKDLLINEMLKANEGASMYRLDNEDEQAITELIRNKYATWDWNFGFSPDYNFKKAIKVQAGFIELHLDVHKGYIERIKVFGDFFAAQPIEEFEQQLVGKRHALPTIAKLLETIDLTAYFGKVEVNEILTLFH
ncbi:lipoate--protein ligase [Sphingobacterium oryzagri]|uniref:lipoate--protein ligase n=1 Tax=Sphingobacterium oryzagri TaxID=3025669 RepID=A0ABY7WGD1_9SPHI|nr:lipoate--protein ligase [Sphingobacterium sp. KACC 22765]WDF67438.1 lipoate--protein ligase [Sphingobacterium sp. KACC 22765]